ncbi:MadS family sensor histidine kinase [Williamsia phyllosphaerae]|uniref:Histidine kinase n=1 Tax=Williamsia phyllosphaerae TaxID=885042 RepID=A0ABQ1USR4_9NOCA|nr:histidine kinase [Williamsia phyllosphaerae]GGF24254.1 histidine kinase [Williamsia phyllosphaerae]
MADVHELVAAMAEESDLTRLTGLRTGKSTFYPQYRGATARLERTLSSLGLIAGALVRTSDGPERLICEVVEAARVHLDAQWAVFALADGTFVDAGPRCLVLGPDGTPYLVGDVEGPPLPDDVVALLDDIRRARIADEVVVENRFVCVPLALRGGHVGALAAWTRRPIDATDAAVVSILASQTAVALQNSAVLEHARRTAADLESRNAELEATQRELGAAQRNRVLDEERHRIARELHDSVTQAVLSAGMQIEVCRNDIPADERRERLDLAKDLTRGAVDQLRSAIYALEHSADHHKSSLPDMLAQLGVVHMPGELTVTVDVGGAPVELPGDLDHTLLRVAGEALFNTAVHAEATRARVRLRYETHQVSLSVDDDGCGEPGALRSVLGVARRGDLGGMHRGLVNMADRVGDAGGEFRVRRSRLGGVRVVATIPLAAARPEVDDGEDAS